MRSTNTAPQRRALLRVGAALALPWALGPIGLAHAESAAPAPIPTSADVAAAQLLRENVRRIIDAVHAGTSHLPQPLRTKPRVLVRFFPFLIAVSEGDEKRPSAIALPLWSQVPAEVQGVFTRWMALAGNRQTPEAFFEDTFNWALVVHELGHRLVMDHVPAARRPSHAREEELCNRFMVAWWNGIPEARERLNRVGATWAALYERLPSPVPAGMDPTAYLQQNYERTTEDPDAYGWFQFRWMAQAWRDRERLTVADTARELTTSATAG